MNKAKQHHEPENKAPSAKCCRMQGYSGVQLLMAIVFAWSCGMVCVTCMVVLQKPHPFQLPLEWQVAIRSNEDDINTQRTKLGNWEVAWEQTEKKCRELDTRLAKIDSAFVPVQPLPPIKKQPTAKPKCVCKPSPLISPPRGGPWMTKS